MLLRCRLPGGVITTKQWQAIDKLPVKTRFMAASV